MSTKRTSLARNSHNGNGPPPPHRRRLTLADLLGSDPPDGHTDTDPYEAPLNEEDSHPGTRWDLDDNDYPEFDPRVLDQLAQRQVNNCGSSDSASPSSPTSPASQHSVEAGNAVEEDQDDEDDAESQAEDVPTVSAYLTVVTPAHKVLVPPPPQQPSKKGKKAPPAPKYKTEPKYEARYPLFKVECELKPAALCKVLAAQLRIPNSQFPLHRVEWRWYGTTTAKHGLETKEAVKNLWELVARPRNKDKQVQFIYTRLLVEDSNEPDESEFVPRALPKRIVTADAGSDDAAFGVVVAAVAAPPTQPAAPAPPAIPEEDELDIDESATVDENIKNMKRKILAKYPLKRCAKHPDVHCKDTDLHFNMGQTVRLTAYATSILLDKASLDKLPIENEHFKAANSLKTASRTMSLATSAAPQPGGPGEYFAFMKDCMSFLGGNQNRRNDDVDSVRGSSPVPELARTLSLHEYASIADFPPEHVERLVAMNHQPSHKLKKRTRAEWEGAGWTPVEWGKALKLDKEGRRTLREMDP